jgi:hypothetical protein
LLFIDAYDYKAVRKGGSNVENVACPLSYILSRVRRASAWKPEQSFAVIYEKGVTHRLRHWQQLLCQNSILQPQSLLFITAVPNTKLCAWGEEDSGGHVL